MKTVQVTEKTVIIRYAGGKKPDEREVRKTVRRALAESGCRPWAFMEVECFEAAGDALVIARPAPSRRVFFFPDEDTLRGAVPFVPDVAGALYRVRDGFLLRLETESICPALHEYGQTGILPAGWEEHAREQELGAREENLGACLRRRFMT